MLRTCYTGKSPTCYELVSGKLASCGHLCDSSAFFLHLEMIRSINITIFWRNTRGLLAHISLCCKGITVIFAMIYDLIIRGVYPPKTNVAIPPIFIPISHSLFPTPSFPSPSVHFPSLTFSILSFLFPPRNSARGPVERCKLPTALPQLGPRLQTHFHASTGLKTHPVAASFSFPPNISYASFPYV